MTKRLGLLLVLVGIYSVAPIAVATEHKSKEVPKSKSNDESLKAEADAKSSPHKPEHKEEKAVAKPATTPKSHATSHATAEKAAVADPETALRWLTNGNTRFLKNRLRNDGQSQKDVVRLSKGQAPHSIVLSCSDSRVPPEVVFDQKLGEIFVVRTAGEALDDNVVGSIEYAVEHLRSRLIVVMGHTSCGAVTAAYNTLDGSSVGTSALDGLVKDIHPRISHFQGLTASSKMLKESWANAQGVASDLTSRSAVIRKSMESGELHIVPAMYDIETGKVTFRGHLQPASERGPASN